jgi:hypothetical protein
MMRAMIAATLVVLSAGCATLPTSGSPQPGGNVEIPAGEIGFIAQKPLTGMTPDAIVAGFLTAVQAGPTSATPFSVALEYLGAQTAEQWKPTARVLITDGAPQVSAGNEVSANGDTAQVTVTYSVVASLDQHGVYTEEASPAVKTATFELDKVDGQWRIGNLPAGMVIPFQLFGQTFHVTTLYFPSADGATWLPDLRWFPERTWRTRAVQELLAGPSVYLAQSVAPVLPRSTTLAIPSVAPDANGAIKVQLTNQIDAASDAVRGVFLAQLQATLSAGPADPPVILQDSQGSIVAAHPADLAMPRTAGSALVLSGGVLWTIDSRTLAPSGRDLSLAGLTPTALAVAPSAGAGTSANVVVRDGYGRIVRLTSGDPVEIAQGSALLAPSSDIFGSVWSGESGGPPLVIAPDLTVSTLEPSWLDGRTVTSLRVSPEGSRVAIVSAGGDGTTTVQVAGVVRDARDVPTALSTPVTVGASVANVKLAVWQDVTTLALLSQDGDSSAIYLAGIGGRAGQPGGLPQRVTGVTHPVSLSASVGTGEILALDADGVLHLRQTTALWPQVGTSVDLAVFPG